MGRKKKEAENAEIMTAETAKEKRVKAAESRINRVLKAEGMDKARLSAVKGLVKRAAFQEVEIEDMEKDLAVKGYTELFQQGEKQTPYERERPIAKLHLQAVGKYKDIIAELVRMLPKVETSKTENDLMGEFIRERE